MLKMKKWEDKESGSFGFDGLYTDEQGMTWNILQREGGSISLYGTRPEVMGHYVIHDTLDNKPPSPQAIKVINKLSQMGEFMTLVARLQPATPAIQIAMPPYFEDNEPCGYCGREIGQPHKSNCRQ